jgi:hypothetical protein
MYLERQVSLFQGSKAFEDKDDASSRVAENSKALKVEIRVSPSSDDFICKTCSTNPARLAG